MERYRWTVCYVLLVSLFIQEMSTFNLRELIFPRNPRLLRVRNPNEIRGPFKSEAVLDFIGLVERHGYPGEEHKITTVDGYNLIFHRIPYDPLKKNTADRPIVFLQHGFIASSDGWVLMGPKKDLAFHLADAGYDVWIGNVRGNSYCRSHESVSPTEQAFWEFSYHEIAMYDISGMIDYVLSHTKQKQLSYVGHSMGTTVAYVLLSSKPEYNNKIKLVVSLAPVAYWRHEMASWVKYILSIFPRVQSFLTRYEIYDIAAQSLNSARLTKNACKDGVPTQFVCLVALFLFSGLEERLYNTTLTPYILSYFPAGGSVKTMNHYYQNIVTGNFSAYDYGEITNYLVYKQKVPPPYEVKKITAPVALIYGNGDTLSKQEDATELNKRLPNVVALESVPFLHFTHLDFIFGINATELLYNRILELLDRHKEVKLIPETETTLYPVRYGYAYS